MKLIECTQGSPDWHRARAGVITASTFSTICKKVNGLDERQARYVASVRAGRSRDAAQLEAGYKAAPRAEVIERAIAGEKVGEFSDEAKNLAFRLAIERISKVPLDEGFETWQAKRGHELEPDARMEHQARLGIYVAPAGFVMTDDGRFGCSADGLIEDGKRGGGSEYKCFVAPDKLYDILIMDDWSSLRHQVHGCLAITGRGWWDQCLYAPFLRAADCHFTRRRVLPDTDFIDEMWKTLLEFDGIVEANVTKLLKLGSAANADDIKAAA